MKPLDPRLVRTVAPVRNLLAVAVACGAAQTGLILLQAWLLARAISGTGDVAAAAVAGVGVLAVARALLTAGAQTAALRGSARVQSVLRRRLVAHVARRPGADAGATATLATRGLDALEEYIAGYLPQLVLAALVPVAVTAVVARADLLSGLVIAATVPLVPVFMALVGRHTQARTRARWQALERLGGHFLEVVEGLPTLAVFRRAQAQAALVREVSDRHRVATMGTLRVAFLSAFVLELVATLSVAVVAVEVGFRLLWGQLDLATALFVLILAPEAYLPLREVGARFHAATEGAAAAESVFDALEATPDRPDAARESASEQPRVGIPAPASRHLSTRESASGHPRVDTSAPASRLLGDAAAPPPGAAVRAAPAVVLDGVGLVHPGRATPALDGMNLELRPGTTTLVTGASGAGKSSLLSLLLRFSAPTSGAILVDGDDLATLDIDAWRRRIAWVPQQPWLFDTSATDNIRLGEPDATGAEVEAAARAAGVHTVLTALPDGYATRLGERGARLSSGERQRVALARAFLRRAACERAGITPLVLLDEPTAHLDGATAAGVRGAARRLLAGATGVVVAHDEGWTDLAGAQLELERERVAA